MPMTMTRRLPAPPGKLLRHWRLEEPAKSAKVGLREETGEKRKPRVKTLDLLGKLAGGRQGQSREEEIQIARAMRRAEGSAEPPARAAQLHQRLDQKE